ncbi:hypothetical protein BG418_11945 [Streptomyces sp. CBMA152]|nr:hypothetical protein [Streptomyces sp. CBMA152]
MSYRAAIVIHLASEALPVLPQAWVDQVADGGLIVAPLPIAAVSNMTVVATIRVSGGEPVVEAVATGGYIEASVLPKPDLDLPGRLHTGARTTLERLLQAAHTEPYGGGEVDWPSWRTFAATLADDRLTMAGLTPNLWAIGHTAATTAAVIQQDGTILADRPNSPPLTILHGWLKQWEQAGRPAPETYTPALVRADEGYGGWDLRLSR